MQWRSLHSITKYRLVYITNMVKEHQKDTQCKVEEFSLISLNKQICNLAGEISVQWQNPLLNRKHVFYILQLAKR